MKPDPNKLVITGPHKRFGVAGSHFYVMRNGHCLQECQSLEQAREWAATTKRLAQQVPADIEIVEKLNAPELY